MGDSDEVNWHPTNYRTNTLGEINSNGEDLVGQSSILIRLFNFEFNLAFINDLPE